MQRTYLLIVTALCEGAVGLLLLIWPSVALALLLGVDQSAPEGTSCARIAGAALLAIGIACWFGRSDQQSSAQFGLLTGVVSYDVAAVVILAYSGWFSSLAGIALWPAVVLHAGLAIWCAVCLRQKS
jgi:hypothetical protein